MDLFRVSKKECFQSSTLKHSFFCDIQCKVETNNFTRCLCRDYRRSHDCR